MSNLRITPEDMKRGTVVNPAWYPVEITKYEEANAKTDGSILHVYEAQISTGKNKNGDDLTGVPLRIQFSEKAPGFAKNFIIACGKQIGPEGTEVKMEAAVGKKMEVHVSNDTYKGNVKNVVDDFRPLKG